MRRVAQGLGVGLAFALGAQSCKTPADSFTCKSSDECDAFQGGVCQQGACVYPDGSGGSVNGSGGKNGTGGSGDGGSGDGGSSGTPGSGGSSGTPGSGGGKASGGSPGTGSTPGTNPDGGGKELTVAAGTIGGKGTIDGTGSFARFVSPACLAFDGSRYVYAGDAYAHTVRRLDVDTGAVTLVAGYPYQQDYRDDMGTEARFSGPECVFYDGTDANAPVLYVSEWDGHRIRRIALNGNSVTTLAGSPDWLPGFVDGQGVAAQFNGPVGMVRRGGLLYVADAKNHAIRTIDLTTKAVSTVIGDKVGMASGSADGPVATARLDMPHGLALDSANNRLFIGEFGGGRIRVLDLTANTVSTLLPNGTGAPASLAYDAARNRVIATMYHENKVVSVDVATKTPTLLAGSGEFDELDGPPTTASFRSPHGVAMAPNDTLYVADMDGPTIRKLVSNAGGAYQTTTFAALAARRGLRDATGETARFWSPGDMALAPNGRTAYVVDAADNCAIRTFDLTTRQVGTLAGGGGCAHAEGTGVAAKLNDPGAMTMGGATGGGAPPLFVAELKGVVRKVDPATAAVTTLNTAEANEALRWRGIAATATTIYVTSEFDRKILQLPVTGGTLGAYAGTGEENCDDAAAAISTFKRPTGLLWDGGTKLYVADSGCGTIRSIDLSQNQVQTVAGGNGEQDENPDGVGEKARFFFPASMQWDRARKGFYVEDMHLVRWVDATTFEVKTILGEKDEHGGVWLSPNPVRVNHPGGFIEGTGGELYISSEGAILRWGDP